MVFYNSQTGNKPLNAFFSVYEVKPVAQGQYVVSYTRCPTLHDCESEWEEADSDPVGDEDL